MTQNECFQIAKLALFNVKLLNELENIGHEELKNLIKDVHEKLSIEEKPALINQSTYHYIFTWMWHNYMAGSEIVNVVVASTVKTYATFLA